jgi:heme/copper-type cytochrome/quinol oxidase subunit 1
LIELAPPSHLDQGSKRWGWLGWGVAAAVYIAFAAFALASMQSGLHGDPRTTNPAPETPRYPPFLGITDWPLVTTVMSALLTVGFFGVTIVWSVRERRAHWALTLPSRSTTPTATSRRRESQAPSTGNHQSAEQYSRWTKEDSHG